MNLGPAARVLLAVCALAIPAAPAQPAKKLTVGLALFPPNVVRSQSATVPYTGFDVDLWQEIARRLGLDYSFRLLPFEQLLISVEKGEVDAALAGISITSSREEKMDFSYAYMDSGLKILTKAVKRSRLETLLKSFLSSGAAQAFGYLVAFIVLSAHIVFFVERKGNTISDRYFPGIFESAWFVLATMTTVGYGDVTPHRWMGRLVAFLVMITGISFFGVIVAEMAAGLTVQELTAEINGPSDLRDRTVATVADSTSVRTAERYGAVVRPVVSIDQAYRLLEQGDVDAVVFDAPALEYYAHETGGDIAVVGPLMNPQPYGIAFPSGSHLREMVNRALLEIREDGTYEQLYAKWFGVSK